MKRLILPLALLLTLVATAPLFAVDNSQRPTLAQDVIRMTQAAVADEAIIAFVQSHRGAFTVSADDMILMSNAKVSPAVMKFVADAAGTRDQSWRDGDRDAQNADREQRSDDNRATQTVYVPSTRVYVSPFWDPYYYYDPFWYGPRLSVNLGFGRFYGGYHGGGFHRGGFHGGGRGGHH